MRKVLLGSPLIALRLVLALTLLSFILLDPYASLADGPASDPGITAQTVEVIPYQATGYLFNIYATAPATYGDETFDDSSFSVGDAAFGQAGGCPLQPTVNTNWPLHSDIVVRKTLSLPLGASNLRIMVVIDNDVEVFLNGQNLSGGLVQHDGCPVLDEFRFDAPDVLLTAGDNLLAVRGRDRGFESFLDLRVLVDLPPIQPVGGLAVDLDGGQTGLPLETVPSSGSNAGLLAGVLAALVAGAIAIALA